MGGGQAVSEVDSERERLVRLIKRVARDVAYEVMDEHLDDYEHKEKPAEVFDPAKFVVTPIVGAIAGIMAVCYGYTYAQTVTWLVTSGFMLWIEYAGKSIVRRFWK
jgi:hypothetical protein